MQLMGTGNRVLNYRRLTMLLLLVVSGCSTDKEVVRPTTILKETVIGVIKCRDQSSFVEGDIELGQHVLGPLLALSVSINGLEAPTNVNCRNVISDSLLEDLKTLVLRIDVMEREGDVIYSGITGGGARITDGGGIATGSIRFGLGGLRPFMLDLSQYANMTNRSEEYFYGKDVEPFETGRLREGRMYKIRVSVLSPCTLTNTTKLLLRQWLFDPDPSVWEARGRAQYEGKEARIREYLRKLDGEMVDPEMVRPRN